MDFFSHPEASSEVALLGRGKAGKDWGLLSREKQHCVGAGCQKRSSGL